MDGAPRVSVVLPVYNRVERVGKAIASVRAQTFQDFELIVVDDGSSDGSGAVALAAAAEDSRIRLIPGPRGGVSAARNRGLAAARGGVVAYLDSDNSWRPGYLDHVVERLEGRVRCTCYSGLEVQTVDRDGRTLKRSTLLNTYDPKTLLFGNQIDLNTFAHTIDLYRDLGGFDERMSRLVDWDLIIRYTKVAPPQRIEHVLADYLDCPDDNRISVHADYAENRLCIAAKHRMAPVPRVLVFGRLPAALNRCVHGLGLEVVSHEKPSRRRLDQQLREAIRGRPIVLWVLDDEERDAQSLCEISRIVRLRSGLSVCLVPGGANMAALDGYHRRFDLIGFGDPDQLERFRVRGATAVGATRIDTFLPFEGPTRSIEAALRTATTLHHPEQSLTIGLGSHPALTALRPALERLGAKTVSITDRPPEGADVLLFGPDEGPLPLHGAALVGRWVHDANASEDALAGPDFVVVPPGAVEVLRTTFPGLRAFAVPETPEQAAHALLTHVGRLLDAPRPGALELWRRPRVLYVHGRPSANTTRKRCFEITKAVSNTFEVTRVPFEELEARHLVGHDLIVIQRWASSALEHVPEAFGLLARFRLFGKRFAYEIDDYIFHFGDDLPIDFMNVCDAVFVSTPKLGALASKHNPNVHVLRNAVDTERFADAPAHPSLGPGFHVIIASTDGMGIDDLDALARGVTSRPVTWHFVSALKDKPVLPNVVHHDPMPVDSLFALTRQCDLVVNLSRPSRYLKEDITGSTGQSLTDFVRAKSETKYLLAGLAGVPLVTTSIPDIYTEVVRHEDNGFIVEDPREMPPLISALLEDPEQRREVAARARRDVLANHTLLARSEEYARAMLEVAATPLDGIVHQRPDLWAVEHAPAPPPLFEQRQLRACALSNRERVPPPITTTTDVVQDAVLRLRADARALVATRTRTPRRVARRLLRLIRP